jgi:uncharacterized protein with GYD domain
MPQCLIAASYTPEGLKGLQRDRASGRQRAINAAIEGHGGKVEALYYALCEDDVYLVVDLPDNTTAAAVGIAVSATGVARTKTTALMTIAEVDAALAKSTNSRPPGSARTVGARPAGAALRRCKRASRR